MTRHRGQHQRVAAWEHDASGANDLLGGTDATFVELVRLIGEVTGRPVSRRHSGEAAARLRRALCAAER